MDKCNGTQWHFQFPPQLPLNALDLDSVVNWFISTSVFIFLVFCLQTGKNSPLQQGNHNKTNRRHYFTTLSSSNTWDSILTYKITTKTHTKWEISIFPHTAIFSIFLPIVKNTLHCRYTSLCTTLTLSTESQFDSAALKLAYDTANSCIFILAFGFRNEAVQRTCYFCWKCPRLQHYIFWQNPKFDEWECLTTLLNQTGFCMNNGHLFLGSDDYMLKDYHVVQNSEHSKIC